MKKSLLFGFAVALTLASCTTNDEVLDTAAQTPMEFSSFVNKGTKTFSSGPIGSLNYEGSTFGVWGYKGKKEDDTIDIPVFDSQNTDNGAQTITYTKSEKGDFSWIYTPLRFWDKTCDYKFFAYAPVKTGVTANISNQLISITDFSVENTIATQTDLMIATPIERTSSYGNLEFTFNHILTKVNVQFFKSSKLSGAEVILVSAKLNNIGNKATYSQTSPTEASWGRPSETIDFVSILSTQTLTEKENLEDKGICMFTNMLMIPQEFAKPTALETKTDDNVVPEYFTMDFTYTINGETFTRNIFMGNTQWNPNMSILYTLTIDADEIIFDSPVVEKWDDIINAEGDINEDPSHVDVPKN